MLLCCVCVVLPLYMQVVKRYNTITKRHFIIFSSTEARPGSSTRRVVPPRWIDLQAEWDEREAERARGGNGCCAG